MPIETRDDFARFIADAPSQQHSIAVAGSLGIELVNAIVQECAELLAFGIILAGNDLGSDRA